MLMPVLAIWSHVPLLAPKERICHVFLLVIKQIMHLVTVDGVQATPVLLLIFMSPCPCCESAHPTAGSPHTCPPYTTHAVA